MKILHVSTSFVAQSAGYRLHKGLRDQGIDSHVLTGAASVSDPLLNQPLGFIEQNTAALKGFLDPIPLKLYIHKTGGPFSISYVPDQIIRKINASNPSIINLHWICGGFIRIESLKKISCPIVWTLHDSWPFTGGCHIPYQCRGYYNMCGNCPVLGSSWRQDLSHLIWARKRKSWCDLSLSIVPVSNWLANGARKSSLFSQNPIEPIHNGIDTGLFKPIDKQNARCSLGLPLDKKIILFGAINSTNDPNKGFQYLVQALKILWKINTPRNTEIVIFGGGPPNDLPEVGFKANYIGRITDETTLASLYASADVFVAPSLSESLPNTILESLACGTPAVAFRVGGIPELIEHRWNGYLAEPLNPTDLAKGIEWILTDDSLQDYLSRNAREKIINEFDIRYIAERYIELYKKISEEDSK